MRSEDTVEIILHIKGKEISTNLLNCIVHFSNQVQKVENKKMRIVVDNKPLRLKGDLRKLTHNAKRWFAYWNANDDIRNISLLQEDNQ